MIYLIRLKSTFINLAFMKHRWFSGRMLACHAGGPGSIPGRCNILPFLLIASVIWNNYLSRSLRWYSIWFHGVMVSTQDSESCDPSSSLGGTFFYTNFYEMIYLIRLKSTFINLAFMKHRWFSGRMLACHAGGPGSIPGRCNILPFLLIASVIWNNYLSRSLRWYSIWFHGVMVSTQDSESCDPSSSLGGTFFCVLTI